MSVFEPDPMMLPREVPLGGPRAMLVRRSLPGKQRRTVGAWCFSDAYGPTELAAAPGMQVPPHPHIGLQTATWLVQGQVRHRDSLGNDVLIRPGQLNLMTAGHGIAHAEHSPDRHGPVLHGVQLWIALPDTARETTPHFEHHEDLPIFDVDDATATVLAGSVAGHASPARVYTPLVGAEFAIPAHGKAVVPLEPDFEHAVLSLGEPVRVDGIEVPTGALRYLDPGTKSVTLAAGAPAKALLIGGVPFEERLVMWWNFVARTHEEIVEARAAWEAERESPGERFGGVAHYDADEGGAALPAPALPNARLRARGRIHD
jgi:redox-sensitive bicupin YhaK (pirin superfamily)